VNREAQRERERERGGGEREEKREVYSVTKINT